MQLILCLNSFSVIPDLIRNPEKKRKISRIGIRRGRMTDTGAVEFMLK